MIRSVRNVVLMAVLLALSGCAQNYANVRTFAQAATSITQSTPALLADNRLSCVRSQQLTEEVLTVLKSQEAEKFSDDYKLICDGRENKLKPIAELNVVLKNYASAVEALAADNFVTGQPEADEANRFLSNMGKLGAFELSADQITAVSSLVQFVTNAMLNAERQGALGKAFSEANQENIQAIIAALTQASAFYIVDLQAEKLTIAGVIQEMETNKQASESLALSEFKLRLQGQQDIVGSRLTAVSQYRDALVKLKDAMAPVAQSISRPGNREILQEVKDFANQVYDVNKQFKAAFGG